MIGILRARLYRILRSKTFYVFLLIIGGWFLIQTFKLWVINTSDGTVNYGYYYWGSFEFYVTLIPLFAPAWYSSLSSQDLLSGIPFQKKNSQVFVSGALIAFGINTLAMTLLVGVLNLNCMLVPSHFSGDLSCIPTILAGAYLYSFSLTAMSIFLTELVRSRLYASIWGLLYSTGIIYIFAVHGEVLLARLLGKSESNLPLIELTQYTQFYRISVESRTHLVSMEYVDAPKMVIVLILIMALYMGLAWLINNKRDVC